jgi:hypothetical protein
MSTEVEQELEEVSLFDNNDKAPAPVESAPLVEEAPAFVVPEKFEGKSMEDVISSYVHLEKEFGNKSNEVGELRKLTDQILLNQTAAPQHPVAPADINDDVGFNDFVDDPRTAVNKVLEDNPRLKALEANLHKREAEISRKTMLDAHPDADALVVSPDFQAWIGESQLRKRILQDAHVSSDAVAASELLDMYKSTRKAATDNAVDERNAIAKDTLKKATVETGKRSTSTKPVFKRTELIHLKITDPARYESMSDIINLAYAEKRVK